MYSKDRPKMDEHNSTVLIYKQQYCIRYRLEAYVKIATLLLQDFFLASQRSFAINNPTAVK